MATMFRGRLAHRAPETHFEPTLDPDTFAIRDYGSLGLLVFSNGGVEVDLFKGLAALAKSRLKSRKAILHMGIAWTMRAMWALTTEKKAPQWMKLLGIGPDNPDWLKSCDCGTSSLTIYAVLAKEHHVLRGTKPDRPIDADDLGRCMRLLKRYPDWRPRLPEVSAKFPEWAPIVERWDELAQLFEAKDYKAINHIIDR